MRWAAALIIGAGIAFSAGYYAASIRYEKDIADGMAAAHKTARVLERAESERLIGALNVRIEKLLEEASLARIERDDARRIADGLRRQNSTGMPVAADDPCGSLRNDNDRLRRLVAEGVELLQQGREGWRSSKGIVDAVSVIEK